MAQTPEETPQKRSLIVTVDGINGMVITDSTLDSNSGDGTVLSQHTTEYPGAAEAYHGRNEQARRDASKQSAAQQN